MIATLLRTLMDFANRIRRYFQPTEQPLPSPARPNEPRPTTRLEERQRLLAHHVRILVQGAATGLFVAGPGGCGKSRTVAATLAEQGVKPILLNSHITPLALYQTLCRQPARRSSGWTTAIASTATSKCWVCFDLLSGGRAIGS